jgi:hypothetical protein
VSARVALIGLGDLGRRIAIGLTLVPGVGDLILLSRHKDSGDSFVRSISSQSPTVPRFIQTDALDVDALSDVFDRQRPDLIIQCASLLSPWAVLERQDAVSTALRDAGFAIQLPAQLPIPISVMEALRQTRSAAAVINCSYPDVTHPILHKMHLAPMAGIGNAGIVSTLVRAVLPQIDEVTPLRVFAHHAHVAGVAQGNLKFCAGTHPRVFVGDEEIPASKWVDAVRPMPLNRELNAITARHAISVVAALVSSNGSLQTSLPGPFGLPGGWPVVIRSHQITLDLPASMSMKEGIKFNEDSSRADGIADIAEDGTVFMTERAKEATKGLGVELTAPLHPRSALQRYRNIERLLKGDFACAQQA